MKPEFSIGDQVTFNSYGDAIPAQVVDILIGNQSPIVANRDNDDRVFYRLTGTNRRKPLVSICSGNSIVESEHYQTNTE